MRLKDNEMSGKPVLEPEESSSERQLRDIRDQAARRVIEALSNARFEYRTVPGIARETGLPLHDIRRALNEHQHLIRLSPTPDRLGRKLFTLRSRPATSQEKLSRLRMFVPDPSR